MPLALESSTTGAARTLLSILLRPNSVPGANPDDLAEDGGFERVATFDWSESAPPVTYPKGITARWTGGALNVLIRVPPETARKALQEGLPLESDIVEIPLSVTFREGKEILRDAQGQTAGVIDATFADVDWDHSELDRVA